MKDEKFLSEKVRAEDVILGSLGFGESVKLVSIQKTKDGFSGIAMWDNGEEFEIKSEDELSLLENWALEILCPKNN